MVVAAEVAVVAADVDVAKATIGTIIIRQRIEKPRHYIFFIFQSWSGPRADIIGRKVFVKRYITKGTIFRLRGTVEASQAAMETAFGMRFAHIKKN